MGRDYGYARGAMELIHTCYRIGDIDRSVAFYEALGFEERRRMPIRDEAINVFMGLPGDGDRLELTYNHGVDSYELGTGYNHIARHRRRPRRHARAARRAGHRAREAALPGARGRLADLLRARPGRLPDRAHRALSRPDVSDRRLAVIDLGSNSFRLVVFTWGEHGGHGWWRRTDEIHEAVRVGAGLDAAGELQPRADGAGARDDRAVRALLPRDRDRRRAAGRHVGDPRRHQPQRVPGGGAQALGAGDRGALARGRGALRLPRGGQLDDARRRRRARPRRRLAAAHPGARARGAATCARGRSAPCA